MSIQTATDKVATGARHLADDVLQSAQDAVQSTRTAANTSLEKAEEGVRALRSQTDPVIDDLAARAQDLAARSIGCRTRNPGALDVAPQARLLKPVSIPTVRRSRRVQQTGRLQSSSTRVPNHFQTRTTP